MLATVVREVSVHLLGRFCGGFVVDLWWFCGGFVMVLWWFCSGFVLFFVVVLGVSSVAVKAFFIMVMVCLL